MGQRTLYETDTANRTLPLVRSIVRDVVEEFHSLRAAGREQRALEAETVVSGGAEERLATLRDHVQAASSRVERYLRELDELGVELRDLETGLVDFPTIVNGEPAFLCWRPGEAEVLWWHSASQGFADRRPLPRGVPTPLR